MTISSAHIVRRFGPVGGMEAYVYKLTQALAEKGEQVFVLCEHNESKETIKNINVIELRNTFSKPRWLAQWGFAKRVARYVHQLPDQTIIHSHERTPSHHVTTFHGPPFLIRKKRLLDCLSPRIHMWTQLEKQELTSPQVKAILPNSHMIGEQLKQLYPSTANLIKPPAYPGVDDAFRRIKPALPGYTIGFLGKEWRRKGLDIACNIVAQLRQAQAKVHFLVAGCEPREIAHLFEGWPKDSYTLAGWTEPETFFGKINLLLHPARSEPFGMAIAEANAVGIPVVISNHCGIAELITAEQGTVCALGANAPEDIRHWVSSSLRLLENTSEIKPLKLSWDQLAIEHTALYRSLMAH